MYIITAKNIKEGLINNDSANLGVYTELGWELVGTRLDTIKMLQEGQVSKNDTIVTLNDRKFLYSKIFDNVISYGDFKNKHVHNKEVIDMADRCMKWTLSFLDSKKFVEQDKPFLEARYCRFYTDFDLITSLDFVDISQLPIQDEYYCLCLRFRSHTPERNSLNEFWDKFLSQMTALNKTVFIVGRGAESKANGKNLIYIDSLAKYASLINHKNCRSTIGNPTGTMLLGHFCCKNKLVVIDHAGSLDGLDCPTNNAVLGGYCVRFMDIPYIIMKEYPEINKFIEMIL